MSDPFTVTSENFYQIDKAEELRLAFSERLVFAYSVPGFPGLKYVWDDALQYYWYDLGDGTTSDSLSNNLPSHGKGFNAQSFGFLGDQQFELGYGFGDISTLALYCEEWDGTSNPFDTGGTFTLAYIDSVDFFERIGLYEDYDEYGWRSSDSLLNGVPEMFYTQEFGVFYGEYLGGWIIDDLKNAYEHMTARCVVA